MRYGGWERMQEVDLLGDTKAHPVKCAQCEAELTSPMVCEGCHTLYPAATGRDHFELLGFPPSYSIDEERLDSAYRALARNVHPDRFTADGADALCVAVRLSAALNQAFAVLRDPLRRADYLLELSGGPSASAVRDVPGTFLADVMLLREEIDGAKTSGDAATLARLRDSLVERRATTAAQIRDTASKLPDVGDPARTELRRLLNSMKYINNLLSETATDPLASAESRLS